MSPWSKSFESFLTLLLFICFRVSVQCRSPALFNVCLLAEPIMGAVRTTHHDDPHHPLPRLQPGFHCGKGVTNTGVTFPPLAAIVCVDHTNLLKPYSA